LIDIYGALAFWSVWDLDPDPCRHKVGSDLIYDLPNWLQV